MDIFNNSLDGRRKNTISHIQSSNKTILYDTKLLQLEIGSLKGDITDLQVKIKSLEGDIRQSTKSLLESESRTRKPLSDLASFISILEKRLKTIENIYNI
jgi:peptidoglycan hydrolase CwlO-like protein